MPAGRPARRRRPGAAPAAAVAVVVLYAVGLAVDGGLATPLVDRWLGAAAVWAPTVLAWVSAVRLRGRRRVAAVLASVGMTSFAAGNQYYLVAWTAGAALPFPSPADLGYAGLYPPLLAALVLAARRPGPARGGAARLDVLVGALGAAAVTTAALGPVVDGLHGLAPLTALALLSCPLGDVLLIGAVAGVATLRRREDGAGWVPPVAGLVVFVVADVVYARQVAAGTYAVGSLLDLGWPVGLLLVSLWLHRRATGAQARVEATARATTAVGRGPEHRDGGDDRALTVPLLAVLAAAAVPAVATVRDDVPGPAVVVAVAALLAAQVRTHRAVVGLRRTAAERRREAVTDALTGLPNRRGLEHLHAALDRPAVLLVLDVEGFTHVNAALGHEAGDGLLVALARRLEGCLSPGEHLVRLGGDEFAVLVGCGATTDPVLRADAGPAARVRDALVEPFEHQGVAVHLRVRTGAAASADVGPTLAELLRAADGGRGRLVALDELRTALTDDGIVLHYQPKADLRSGAVEGVEALVRWQHPSRGLLPPADFLPLAEEAGLLGELTAVVLDAAVRQAASWRAGGHLVRVAVNLPASSVLDADLAVRVRRRLAAHGLPPAALLLEITEDVLMLHRERAAAVLAELRADGVQVAIDDFGTGYSSLSYLADLPLDELKLDRSFVRGMATDARRRAIVTATVGLAHALGLRVVAEGVETADDLADLARLGCDQVQGYVLSPPVPPDEVPALLGRGLPGLPVVPGVPGPRAGVALPSQRAGRSAWTSRSVTSPAAQPVRPSASTNSDAVSPGG
ncbi:putative bifunctional diguanylate cyclase/phosphodiesterase [Cellulomonas marina]|uniref:Diguanylate cyclase (GGDEF) domain-containing protein n=1 Tax=Cellulomonas marina TaxID=988821 RepID=A0A1I1A4C6_9CELL|nr:bifunctional diguanylate cyclase/phosphodiesterase [Cellulomonas marina]GIG30289.1 hypothetical protein Cma02nite_28890 [Cellulomonas marina]SFB31350.1 diguanylate cyclase (GGDEF) domain-containing protein [Cellulomonas marina]